MKSSPPVAPGAAVASVIAKPSVSVVKRVGAPVVVAKPAPAMVNDAFCAAKAPPAGFAGGA